MMQLLMNFSKTCIAHMWCMYMCMCICLLCVSIGIYARMAGIIRLHDDRTVKRRSKDYRFPNARLLTAIAGQFVHRARIDAAFLVDASRLSSITSVSE